MVLSKNPKHGYLYMKALRLGYNSRVYYQLVPVATFIIAIALTVSQAFGQEKGGQPVLKQAVMCEDLRGSIPVNPGVVFPSSLGRIICFTEFDPVPEKTFIYHKYYQRDELSAKVKLTLNPPRWATFSRIQLRETDKGPWRIEITDMDDNILHIIRFSITD